MVISRWVGDFHGLRLWTSAGGLFYGLEKQHNGWGDFATTPSPWLGLIPQVQWRGWVYQEWWDLAMKSWVWRMEIHGGWTDSTMLHSDLCFKKCWWGSARTRGGHWKRFFVNTWLLQPQPSFVDLYAQMNYCRMDIYIYIKIIMKHLIGLYL